MTSCVIGLGNFIHIKIDDFLDNCATAWEEMDLIYFVLASISENSGFLKDFFFRIFVEHCIKFNDDVLIQLFI